MSNRRQLAENGVRPGFQAPRKETDLQTSPALLISLKEKFLFTKEKSDSGREAVADLLKGSGALMNVD